MHSICTLVPSLSKKQYYTPLHSTAEKSSLAEMLEQRPLLHYAVHHLCKGSTCKLILWTGHHNGCCVSNMFTS